jgi:ApaG protein
MARLTLLFISTLFLGAWAFLPRVHHKSAAKLFESSAGNAVDDRNKLWKEVSQLEKEAVDILSSCEEDDGDKKTEAMILLAQSATLKNKDPFIELADGYSEASLNRNDKECRSLLEQMESVGLPPHLQGKVSTVIVPESAVNGGELGEDGEEAEAVVDLTSSLSDDDIDLSSTFSDTVTDKIRVKVNSFYDKEKSDPANGKYMFWYKVAIYNECPEPVQIVARMWEIEKLGGSKETVRGAGVMSAQPIISAGDVFTYQSVCPLKVTNVPAGKRVLGSMSGAYTICKGNMGQVNFSVKVGKFMLILPENDE